MCDNSQLSAHLTVDSSQPCYPGIFRRPAISIPSTNERLSLGMCEWGEIITEHKCSVALGWAGTSGTSEMEGRPRMPSAVSK